MDVTHRHILQTVYDRVGIAQFKKDLYNAELISKKFGTTLARNSQLVGQRFRQTFDKDGKLVLNKMMQFDQAGKRLGISWKQVDGTMKNYGMTVSTVSKKQQGFTDILVKAGKRALMVAPIWLAIRSAMMLVIRTLGEGMEYWKEWDKALMKSRAVIHGVGKDIEGAFKRLRAEIKAFAMETGESLTKLTSAFYRFGTVGIQFEESLAGMKTSARLAIAMFGDTDQIARVLAQSYRLLGDTIDATIPQHQRLESIGMKIYGLWRDNAFEVNELMGALQNFIPTANTANFTLDQTIALLASLHTAGMKGTRAGRLLRTSMNKLVQNLDELGTSLGVYVNPEMDNTFDVFMRVLGALKKVYIETGNLGEASQILRKVFGGVRTQEAVKALITVFDSLQKNLEVTGGDITELADIWRKRMEEIEDSVSRQLQIQSELRKELGMAFWKGILAGEDFADTLKKLNTVLRGTITLVQSLGQGLRNLQDIATYLVPIWGAIALERKIRLEPIIELGKQTEQINKEIENAVKGLMSPEEIVNLKIKIATELSKGKKLELPATWRESLDSAIVKFEDIANVAQSIRKIDIAKTSKETAKSLLDVIATIRKNPILEQRLEKELPLLSEIVDKLKIRAEARKRIPQDIQETNRKLATELEIIEMQLLGMSKREQAEVKLNSLIRKHAEKSVDYMFSEVKGSEQALAHLRKGREKSIEARIEATKQIFEEEDNVYEKLLEIYKTETAVKEIIEERGKRQKAVLEEGYKRWEDYENLMMAMLRSRGHTELEVAMARLNLLRQIQAGEEVIYKQKQQTANLALKAISAERDKLTDLYLQYEKADAMERGKLRRVMELRYMKPTELARAYESSMYDKALIEKYAQHFSREQLRAIAEVIDRLRDLPGEIGRPELPGLDLKITTDSIRGFWDIWLETGTKSIDKLFETTFMSKARDFYSVAEEKAEAIFPTKRKDTTAPARKITTPAGVDIYTNVEDINVHIVLDTINKKKKEEIIDDFKKEVVKQVEDALEDPKIIDKISKEI